MIFLSNGLWSLLAGQMRKAFDVVMRGCVDEINRPGSLAECCSSHVAMCK